MTPTPDDRPTTIKTSATVGDDCVLKLDVAPGYYEVFLVRTAPKAFAPHPDWPPGFWDNLETIDDPAFKRYPLGPPRIPPALDAE